MIDTKTLSRVRLLERDARPGLMVWAFHHAPTDNFLLLPDADYGSKAFQAEMAKATKDGAILVSAMSLMNGTPGGEALIEYELMPGASEEAAKRARVLYRDKLIEAGILTVGGTAQS